MPEHKTYMEPYAGSAAVYFVKPRVDSEILSDADPTIINAYSWIRDASDSALQEMVDMDWMRGESQFDAARQMLLEGDSFAQTYGLIYVRRASWRAFGLKRQHSGDGKLIPITLQRLSEWRERLQGTELIVGDGASAMAQYDNLDTVIFVDPPWPGFLKGVGAPEAWSSWSWDDMDKLLSVLKGMKQATWFYLESPELAEKRSLPSNWFTTIWEKPGRSLAGKPKIVRELIISNRPLPGESGNHDAGIKPRTLGQFGLLKRHKRGA